MTFAVNTTSAGTITARRPMMPTTTGGDDLTVNTGVTVESTGGSVIFEAPAIASSLQDNSIIESRQRRHHPLCRFRRHRRVRSLQIGPSTTLSFATALTICDEWPGEPRLDDLARRSSISPARR